MIEAIEKIPIEILEAQLKRDGEEGNKSNPKYIIVFLDEEFKINNIDEGTYEEICEKYKLNKSSEKKNLIRRFNYYLGVDYAFDKYGNKGYGGQSGLYTCSLLHYNFAKETFKSIIKERKRTKIDKTISALKEDKAMPLEIKEVLLKLINNFFIDLVLNRKENEYGLSFKNKDSCKIIFIPHSKTFIKKYNKFEERYLFDKFRRNICIEEDEIKKYKFPLDFFETPQIKPLAILYSKFGKNNIVFQDEKCNLLSEEEFESLNLFRKILKKRKILPLPLFEVPKDSNIYEVCFSKEESLLKKLKIIYDKKETPFDYCLISNFEGYRFENIVNYDFDTTALINDKIYSLSFNKYFGKKEKKIKEFHSIKSAHNKNELLRDISFLFWSSNKPEQVEKSQISFFNPSNKLLKNNLYLRQLFLENKESIVNQIFKSDNTFINYKLQHLIKKILRGVFKSREMLTRYENFHQVRNLLLINLKYDKSKMKSNKVKKIEQKLSQFKKKQKLDEIESDFEAYVYSGLIIKHLLSKTSSTKSSLEIMTKYLISASTTKQLKDKIIFLTGKYGYQLNITPKMWERINKLVLENDFRDDKLKENLIPFFIGFYMDFWISKEKQEDLNNK